MSKYIIPFMLGVVNLALVYLTFVNDEHLANVFHGDAWAWGLVIHITILAMPAINAFLPEGSERNVGQFIWAACLILAFVGNVIGSIAHASGVPVRDVLDTIPSIGDGLLYTSIGGGFLLPAMEAAFGWLFEKRLAALFAGEVAPVHETIESTAAPVQQPYFDPQPVVQPLPDFVPPPLPPLHDEIEVAAPSNIIRFQPQPTQTQPQQEGLTARVKALLDAGITDNAKLYAALGATSAQDQSKVRAAASKYRRTKSA